MALQGEAREIRAIKGSNGVKTTPAPPRTISYADHRKCLRRIHGAAGD